MNEERLPLPVSITHQVPVTAAIRLIHVSFQYIDNPNITAVAAKNQITSNSFHPVSSLFKYFLSLSI